MTDDSVGTSFWFIWSLYVFIQIYLDTKVFIKINAEKIHENQVKSEKSSEYFNILAF